MILLNIFIVKKNCIFFIDIYSLMNNKHKNKEEQLSNVLVLFNKKMSVYGNSIIDHILLSNGIDPKLSILKSDKLPDVFFTYIYSLILYLMLLINVIIFIMILIKQLHLMELILKIMKYILIINHFY